MTSVPSQTHASSGDSALGKSTGVSVKWRSSAPVIPRDLYAEPRFNTANAVGFLLNLGLFGGTFMLSVYLQKAQGASPLAAGIKLVPVMAVILAGNLTFSKIAARSGTRKPLIIGFGVAAASVFVLALVVAQAHYWLLVVLMMIANFCIGLIVPALTAAMMDGAAGTANANMAGAALNANRQIGALVGVAIMSALLAAGSWVHGAELSLTAIGAAYTLSCLLTWRFMRSPLPVTRPV